MKVSIKSVRPNLEIGPPQYQTPGAAGMDIQAANDEPVILQPGAIQLIPSGFAIALPNGFEGQIRPRSGLASQHGVTVVNAPGTVDSDYRGEIKVALINLGRVPFTVERGMRIAQMVIQRVETIAWNVVADLPSTDRGSRGFGHTNA